MKLNIKKFMMTEMGGELEETIKAWDQALEERRKATPGIGDPNQGLGFGYCLIHNPTGCGGYIVTNMKSLTKRQKEFLYGYFMDMGDRFKAEQFIKE